MSRTTTIAGIAEAPGASCPMHDTRTNPFGSTLSLFLPVRTRKHTARTSRIAVTSLAVLLSGAGCVQADELPGRNLLSVRFEARAVNKIDIGDFHFVPGQPAPIHTHVAPVFGYVSKGAIYYQIEGEKPQLLKTGDAFYEPVGPRILHFDNASQTEEAVFTDINLQRDGEPFIVFPKPLTAKIDRRAFPTLTLDGSTVSEVSVIEQTLQPDGATEQSSSKSRVFYVAGGDVSVQFKGDWAVIYHTGETFFKPANKAVARIVNTSSTTAAKLIVFCLLNPQSIK